MRARSGSRILIELKSLTERQVKLSGSEAQDDFYVGTGGQDAILCRVCGHKIATIDHMITINGEHKHTFTNPAGVSYTIGCFSAASGCFIYGTSTYEFTWFKGFSWRLALCANCLVHLGWHYQSSDAHFFGLILAHLIENTKTH
jgi:hypothetical protein